MLKLWKHYQRLSRGYGSENIWIAKPTGVSRGSGIMISNDLVKLTYHRHSKLVQKYIENPLLLECGRKFDIRQWVLLTSLDPLTVFAFRKCYARFSSLQYSNNDH